MPGKFIAFLNLRRLAWLSRSDAMTIARRFNARENSELHKFRRNG
jgi:hypothetical protein